MAHTLGVAECGPSSGGHQQHLVTRLIGGIVWNRLRGDVEIPNDLQQVSIVMRPQLKRVFTSHQVRVQPCFYSVRAVKSWSWEELKLRKAEVERSWEELRSQVPSEDGLRKQEFLRIVLSWRTVLSTVSGCVLCVGQSNCWPCMYICIYVYIYIYIVIYGR
jgi:hypothetical protein